jgi:hypothetical protein
MKKKNELKIFRKTSIEYLKKMYSESASYIFDKENWRSTLPESYGESKVLLKTRKSISKFGKELKIFKSPSIVGLKITYYKSMNFVFDKYRRENRMALIAEENYLLRDLPESAAYTDESEWKIFKLPTIEKLELLYLKNQAKY